MEPQPGPIRSSPEGSVGSDLFWRQLRPDEGLLPPQRIGPFEIQRVLGSGGYGVVYLARQERPDRLVALKVLRPGLATRDTLKRFEREAHVLARLQHPGIAQVYEAGQADFGLGPQPYCAMEYVRGKPITVYARETAPSLRERVQLLVRLCEAVQHAHQKGVVHRDLSPSNILVDEEGRPRVVDFGIAHLVEADGAPVSLQTQPGQLLGTLPYSSPEQVGGHADDVDTRADVYALGVVAFELMTGRLPYDLEGLGLAETIRVIGEVEALRAGSLDPALRGDLETILAKALAKAREQRYASAAELGADLERWLRDEPIFARPASTLYQLRKLARRHRGLVAGIVLALLAVAVGLAGTLTGLVRARRAEAGLARRAEGAERELSFLMDYALEELAPRIGTTQLQQPLLEELRVRIESQLEENPQSTRLRKDLARTLEALGLLEVGRDQDDLGRELQERALAIRVELVREQPDDIALRRALSVSHVRIGDIERKHGRPGEALAWYRKALERDEELAARGPANARLLDDLCWSLERVGVLLLELEDRDTARALFERRHALALDLIGWDPEPEKARFNLSTSHSQLAGLAAREENWAGAARHAREQVRLARDLVAWAPGDWHYARYLAGAYGAAARAEKELGNRAMAEEMLRGSAAVTRYLAEMHPEDGELLQATSHYHAQVAGFLLEEGRRDEAIAGLTELARLGEDLERRAPGAIGPLRVQAESRTALAHALSTEEAVAQRKQALRLCAQVAEHAAAGVEDQLRLVDLLLESGAVDDAARAVEAAERACRATSPTRAEARERHARALLAAGRPAEAIAALGGYEGLPSASPETISSLRDACDRALVMEATPETSSRVLEGEKE